MSGALGRGAYLRLFSSGIVTQALTSAANFTVSLILIRLLTDAQYGYYVLVVGSLYLLMGLQSAYIQAPMVHRLTHFDLARRGKLIGSLFVAQRQLIPLGAGFACLVAGCLLAPRLRHKPDPPPGSGGHFRRAGGHPS